MKPKDIEVPKDNPYQNDALDRKSSVEILARLIRLVESPCVVGIDAGWGNGKTTFLRMLDRCLVKQQVPVVSFNAWESDYVSDPFTAIITELTDKLAIFDGESCPDTKEKIKKAIERAKAVIKTRRPAILRVAFEKVPLLGKLLGLVIEGLATPDVDVQVSTYREARKSVEEFAITLQELAQSVSADRKNPLLVVAIDELDRCRPSYAVELLEVAKHLFAVDGVVFVIAVNRAELAHSVQALYGSGFDARGYLGRFFDLDFRLPEANRSRFIEETIEAVRIHDYLDRTKDMTGYPEFLNFDSLMQAFFGESIVSLRTVQRAIHHVGLMYAVLAEDNWVIGITTAVLVILRTLDQELYYRFVDGHASDMEVVDSISKRLGKNALSRHESEISTFEAWMIVSQRERNGTEVGSADGITETPLMQRYRARIKDTEDKADPSVMKHVKSVLEIIDVIDKGSPHSYEGIRFTDTVQRIELFSPDLGEQQSDQ